MAQREMLCCLCGGSAPGDEMFGLTLFPALNVEIRQQWFAHPACVKRTFHPDALEYLRDEIAAKLPT
jgi:hypothetical protein